ncbi:Hsp20/alpha crystallin family protein [Actinotalea sp. K2]|uniref:Hsp20/alpha crystallin family protein n=1 Tax=Actinotalea sp. K2 TaxID=2939438 RepID=UPI002017EBA8|nr:Hsp20/alpha crystallin family protein [Actinotalea sp. K2]MCL3860403.1 Hsp20/alpha crystallin family protein [Actinotalea sp. K2]
MATRYDPFVETARWMDQIMGAAREAGSMSSVPTMPMDLYRSGDHYVLHLDLPGADPGSVDVNVEDRTLTIRGERTARAEGDVQWLARERPSGTYVRQLTLGRGVSLDAVEASYTDGVLTLTIPVAEQAKPRRIEIQHAAAPTAIGSAQADETRAEGSTTGSA